MLAVLLAAGLGFGGLSEAAAQSQAQDWPQRPVRLIVALSPGSATDVTARLYAKRLS